MDPSQDCREPSGLERLPLEIREKIYENLGYPVRGFIWVQNPLHGEMERVKCSQSMLFFTGRGREWKVFQDYQLDDQKHQYVTQFPERALLHLNRRVRYEVLYFAFRATTVTLGFELGLELIDEPHCNANRRIKSGPMGFPTSMFAHLTSIHLHNNVGRCYENLRPVMTAPTNDEILDKKISSIRFVASHCPKLKVLRVDLSEHVEAIIKALLEVVLQCKDLETLRIPRHITTRMLCLDGVEHADRWKIKWKTTRYEITDLNLSEVSNDLREEVVHEWARLILKQAIEDGNEANE